MVGTSGLEPLTPTVSTRCLTTKRANNKGLSCYHPVNSDQIPTNSQNFCAIVIAAPLHHTSWRPTTSKTNQARKESP